MDTSPLPQTQHDPKRSSVKILLHALLMVAVAIVSSGLTFFFLNNDMAKSPKVVDPAPTVTEKETTPADLKTYHDNGGKYTITYPSNWTLKSEQLGESVSNVYFTSPYSGSLIRIFTHHGGRGGGCEPEPDDKPHDPNNSCPTRENLSSESLNVSTYMNLESKGKKTPVNLITAKFSKEKSSEAKYIIGLDNQTYYKVNVPVIGYALDLTSVDVYDKEGAFKYSVNFYASGLSESFLSSIEGEEIKQIFRSFQFDPTE